MINKEKDILILGKDQYKELAAEAQYSVNFSRSNTEFCLRLHYNGSKSILFFIATKKYLFKAKDFEIKKMSNNMKKNNNQKQNKKKQD